MSTKIVIRGRIPLHGEVSVSGMKNAALPILFATVLVNDVCVLENIPNISDISDTLEILHSMGADVTYLSPTTVRVDTRELQGGIAPLELVGKMRASNYLLGAELARFGEARVGYPGGCDFSRRPLDQHFKGFEALGAIEIKEHNYIHLKAEHPMEAANIHLDIPSVGATVNIMLASVFLSGTTVIDNVAKEPHIVDLASFLNSCGANITGAGTSRIKVTGVEKLQGCTYSVIPDMIEAGTFMAAAAITHGCVKIHNVIPKHVESITTKLLEMGVSVEEADDESILVRAENPFKSVNIKTQYYPGFPTDMHPQFIPLLCLSEGMSSLQEAVWEHRFSYVPELQRMGAQLIHDGRTVTVLGVETLYGATVQARDLRAGAALIIAALAAEGTTEIDGVEYIKRGYDSIVQKLAQLGADIAEVTVPNSEASQI